MGDEMQKNTTHVVSCIGKIVYNIDMTCGRNGKYDECERRFLRPAYGNSKNGGGEQWNQSRN